MSKRLNDENTYPFYWLDQLAETTLNPQKNNVEQLKPPELAAICDRLPEEFSKIKSKLKSQAFCLYNSDHIKVVAGHYDQAVRLLQQQAQRNLKQYPDKGPLYETGQLIVRHLDELRECVNIRYDRYLSEQSYENKQSNPQQVQRTVYKILCKLSVDQMGLILKAADDLKLIVARSLSQVYKTIVPFLSTGNKKDISWDSMRSSTYHPEEVDKAAAISALEKMISKIKEYR